MPIPVEILQAVDNADVRAVERWLDAGGDVDLTVAHAVDSDAVDDGGMTLLARCLRPGDDYYVSTTEAHLLVGRMLLARGADPDVYNVGYSTLISEASYLRYCGDDLVYKWLRLLLSAGANVNAREMLGFHECECEAPLLARVLYYFYEGGGSISLSKRLVLATLLLRAGAAAVDNIVDTQSASWCLERALANRPDLAQNEHFLATQKLVAGVTEAGSYKKWVRSPHRSVLRLRSLVARGRATPKKRSSRDRDARAKHAIAFLLELGDNGTAWNILSFWKEA